MVLDRTGERPQCWADTERPQEEPKLSETRPLTFYPRSVIGCVRLSWTGEMTITLPGVGPDVRAGVNFWQVSKAKGHLKRVGYRLE